MIAGRFKIQCRPDRVDEMAAAIAAVEGPSRKLPGVLHFDVARSVTDPDAFLAFEVFEDREAFDRQNAQPQVAELLRLVDAGATIGGYEWSMWDASPA